MKCSHCGFTYEDEVICPICGTPAPRAQDPAPAPVEAPTPAYPPQNAPVAAPAAAPKPAAPQPAPPRHSRGLHIATLCVLSVIAVALIIGTMLQSVALLRDQRRERQFDELLNNAEGDYYADSEWDEADMWDDSYEMQSFTDSTMHKIGESYDFGKGVLTLKSAAVVKPSTFDTKQTLIAFALEIKNNTAQEQVYEAPNMVLGSDGYDADHYAFSEFNIHSGDISYAIQPGETYSAVYYYNVTLSDQLVSVELIAYGNDYTANTSYSLNLKDIK